MSNEGYYTQTIEGDVELCDNPDCALCGEPSPHGEYQADRSDAVAAVPHGGYASDGEYYFAVPAERRRTYFITATVQLVVEDECVSFALIEVKDRLNSLIADGPLRNDPLNGATIEDIQDITSR